MNYLEKQYGLQQLLTEFVNQEYIDKPIEISEAQVAELRKFMDVVNQVGNDRADLREWLTVLKTAAFELMERPTYGSLDKVLSYAKSLHQRRGQLPPELVSATTALLKFLGDWDASI